MSIQSSSTTTKSAIVAATMLAIEAEGHGLTNGVWGPEFLKDDTPLSRQQIYGDPTGLVHDYINGAENRMDGALTKCDGGWSVNKPFDDKFEAGVCKPADQICKNVWAGTVAGFAGDTKHLGDDINFFGCPYTSEDKDGQYADNGDLASGCCGGFQYMTHTDDDSKPTTYPILKNGEDTGRKTQCWAANGNVPDGTEWRDEEYLKPQATWEEGQEVHLSWISTANHGGMYEYGVVCDGDETYENFSKPEHRLTFVAGDENSGFFEGIGGWNADGTPDPKLFQPRDWKRLDGSNGDKSVNGGQEILSNDNNWAFLPAPVSLPTDDAQTIKQRSTMTENNFTMRNKLRLPTGISGQKCTLGWFWWGMVSAGTFISCMDITITPATTLRNGSSSTQDNL